MVKFRDLTKRLLGVPKEDLQRELEKEKAKKRKQATLLIHL